MTSSPMTIAGPMPMVRKKMAPKIIDKKKVTVITNNASSGGTIALESLFCLVVGAGDCFSIVFVSSGLIFSS